MTFTAAILDFAATPHVVPPAVRADAVRLLADTLAVMAAGAASAEAQRVKAALSPQPACPEPVEGLPFVAATSKDSPSTSSGTRGFDAGQIAYQHGFAIHCLEWDAVHEPAVVHALSVVTAALLATAHRQGGCDTDSFLTALAVGVDIASGLGVAAIGPMRFFRPATAGVIGAALAVARLEGLSRSQMADVFGLAYSFAGGTMQAHVEASVALPLQIGRAAQVAVQAVDLVKAGLSGPHDVLEGPFGYAALIEPLDLARYTPGAPWRISEVSIKPYPSGRASHGALGALQAMRDAMLSEHGGDFDVTTITLRAPPLIHRLIGRPFVHGAPMSYNRLCLAFLAPLMLRHGVIDPRIGTTDEAMAAKVKVVLDDNPDPNAMVPQQLSVHASWGQWSVEIPSNPGSPALPMTPAQAESKYTLCRALAGDCDPRIFDDPIRYATNPIAVTPDLIRGPADLPQVEKRHPGASPG